MGAGLTGSANAASQTGTQASSAGIAGLNTAAQAPVPMTNAVTAAGTGTYHAGSVINQGLAAQNLGANASASAVGGMAQGAGAAAKAVTGLYAPISKGIGWLADKFGSQGSMGVDHTKIDQGDYNGSYTPPGAASGDDMGSGDYTQLDPLDYKSSKKSKQNFKAVDGDAVLDGLAAAAPKSYNYKAGQGDGGAHVGPMAEDMQKQFGNRVAPGGKKIDVISQLGLSHVAINALTKRVKQLEGRA